MNKMSNTVTLDVVNKEVSVGDIDKEDGTVVSGIAIGKDDTTVGQSGNKKYWSGETLKKASETLAGSPLVVDHENDSQSVVGKVIKSGYKESVGVIYEAILYDEELAEKISNGLLEVSIRGYHPDPEEMEKNDEGAIIVEKLVFDNLSIVPQGASPSNTLEIGEHAELERNLSSLFNGNVSNLSKEQSKELSESPDFGGIVDTHNRRVMEEYQTTDTNTVEKVYNRGLQNYSESDEIPKKQFAAARVSAFLRKMRGDDVSEEYTEDDDLLGEEHPEYSEDSPSGKATGIPREISEESKQLLDSTFDDFFSSKKKAQTRAKELGIEGYHEVSVEDKTFYMPGSNRDSYIKSLANESGFEEGVVKETEQSSDESWMYDDSLSLYEKLCKEVGVESELLEPVAELEDLDEVYDEWNDAVNMTADSFAEWRQHPCSDKASIRPTRVQKRNMSLLDTPKSEWGDVEIKAAKRSISFIARMRGQRPDDIEDGPDGCPSKWSISLMNWGYNPFDGLPPEPTMEDAEASLEIQFPDYKGIDAEGDWSAPDFEDFREPYNISEETSWSDLDEGMRSAVAQHFLYSADGYPPENYTDMKFPVVHPDGELSLSALRSAKQMVGRSDIPEDQKKRLREVINNVAKREFDKNWGNEPTEMSVDIPKDDLDVIQTQAHQISSRANANLQQFKEVYRRGVEAYELAPDNLTTDKSESSFALERVEQYSNLLSLGLPKDEGYVEDNDLLPSNHPRKTPMDTEELTQTEVAGFRDFEVKGANDTKDNMTEETDERIEELEAAVEELEQKNDELLEENKDVRSEYAEVLCEGTALTEDELVEKFTVEELRDKYEEYDDAKLASAGPSPEAGDADEAELSTSDEQKEERIEELEAQAENYEAMGWTAALEQTNKEIEELRN